MPATLPVRPTSYDDAVHAMHACIETSFAPIDRLSMCLRVAFCTQLVDTTGEGKGRGAVRDSTPLLGEEDGMPHAPACLMSVVPSQTSDGESNGK
jgi:hypothetical protein